MRTKKSGKKIYLFYKRIDEIPREIIINDIELYYNNATKITLGLPNKLEEIEVDGDGGSVKKK